MLETGRVVYSKSGRDKGYFLVVVESDEKFVLVCDGKERPIERPKRKNVKHIGITNTVLDNGSMSTTKKLKKALAQFNSFDALLCEEE